MSSYSRNYVPWSKSNLSPSSYTGSGSSYSSTPKSSDSPTTKTTATESKYDSGYTGRRYGTPSSSTGTSSGSSSYRSSYTPSERSTSTPSKYGTSTTSPSSYLSNKDKDKYSSTPSPASTTKETKETERPSIREKYNMGPALPSSTISTATKDDKPSIRDERQSLIDKYSTTSSSNYPSRISDSTRSYKTPTTPEKKEDTSTSYNSRSLSRTASTKAEPSSEPEKTAGTGYNSLSPYRLYGGRTSSSYTRSTSKDSDTTSSTSTPATTPVSNPTSLRYGTTSRYGSTLTKSPVNTPTVSVDKHRPTRTSRQEIEDIKVKDRSVSPNVVTAKEDIKVEKAQGETKMVSVVTRGTSPTAPSTSSFLRTRRADLARVIEKTVERPVKKPEMVDKEIQSDRGDDTARLSRFGSTSRSTVSPWTSYLDRINTSSSSYSPAVSKYSTRSYGTTPTRSEREPTVTRMTPNETTSPLTTTNTSTPVTVALKEDNIKERDKTEIKTSQASKVTESTPGNVGLTKSPSIKKVNEVGLKKATSITKLNELNSKTTVGSTKVDDITLNKTTGKTDIVCSIKSEEDIGNKKIQVSSKVDDASSKNNSYIATKVGEVVDVKDVPSEPKDKVLVRLKRTPSVKKLDAVNNNSALASPIKEPVGVKKTFSEPVIDDKSNTKLLENVEKLKDEETSIAEKYESSQNIVDSPKNNKIDTEKVTLKSTSRKSSLKTDTVPKSEDIRALTGALEGLIRANSGQTVAKMLLTKTDSLSESESEIVKSKSSSSQSVSESDKLKTPPLSPPPSQTKLTSPSLNRKYLPPLVPKSDSNSSLKTSSSQHSLNKDFRKSTLNMDVTSSTEAEELNKAQEKQRNASKLVKTTKRSTSTGSDVSETSETSDLPCVRGKSSPLPPSTTATTLLKPSSSLTNNSKLSSSPIAKLDTLKVPESTIRTSRSPSASRMSESSSGDTESSESDSSSSSEDDEEEETQSRSSASNLIQSSKSHSTGDKNKFLLSPASSKCLQSSADESSIADKPPRPPSSPKPPQKEEAKSFLMRALAPVTNYFKAKTTDTSIDSSNENLSESLQRTESTQSLSKSVCSDKEDGKKSEAVAKKKHKISRIESGERAWWLESSDNIPEGVKRIKSSKSISKLSTDSEPDSKKSNKSIKKYKLGHAESGERAWWLDSSSNIPEGIERIKSNAAINRIVESDKESLEEHTGDDKITKQRICRIESGERAWWLDSSSNIPEGIQRNRSNASLHKTNMESDKESSVKKKHTKKYKTRTETSSNSDISEGGVQRVKSKTSLSKLDEEKPKKYSIKHQESGEKAWWLNNSSSNLAVGKKKIDSKLLGISKKDSKSDSSEEESEESENESEEDGKNGVLPKFPLVLQDPIATSTPKLVVVGTGRTSPYDNIVDKTPVRVTKKRPKNLPLFISSHTNIDDILGSAVTLVNPMTKQGRNATAVLSAGESDDDDEENEDCEEVDAKQVRIHDSTAQKPIIQRIRDVTEAGKRRQSRDANKLDDTALQLYKDGDYGAYLDLEASISEQQEEFDGFQTNRKNSIVLRTQLSVRVHTIIEKLLNSEGRELRRALFSLKQIFQEDKDLVHEFVQNDGLACLIKVGSEADQNYQNYILRALGQVMLYVDGMNGVMDHNRTVQWLYTLIASKFRLVVKTALKLLLVFVEYVDTNCMLLVKAVNAVDASQGLHPWSNIMKLIKDYDAADTELLIYATTLVNKTLNGIPDQDTYYDQVDALEEQGVEGAIQRYMSKQGTDLDLLRQFQIYEAVLHHEDGEEKGTPLKQLDETIRKTLRNRKSPVETSTLERRKSRRHSTGTSPLSASLSRTTRQRNTSTVADEDETGSSSSRSSPGPGEVPHLNGTYKDKQTGDAGVTPALRRRRERAERQRSFIREQQETSANLRASLGISQDGPDDENELSNSMSQRVNNGSFDGSNKLNRVSSRKDLTPLMNAVNKLDSADNESKSPDSNGILKNPWSRVYNNNGGEDQQDGDENNGDDTPERKLLLQLKRENTVKDLTQKLASQNILGSPVEEKLISRIGDMSGLISKAKEGLAKSKSKADVLKSPSGDVLKLVEIKKSETELHWEELVSGMNRPLEVCDLDFTDLISDDETDVLSPALIANGIPPPPPPAPMPPIGMKDGPPPPPPNRLGNFIPPPCPLTSTNFGVNLKHQRSTTATSPDKTTPTMTTTPTSKTKKTVKLFWKEVRDEPRLGKTAMIWDELNIVTIDTQKLEHLFESRAKDLITKKQQEMNKTKEIIVLDHKRSNAINIGMTKLPPPRSIKTAIMKMDATIMTREGIEKLLTMLPTEDEQSRIQEAQMANPEMPLGSAEQFLLTLASISELSARLKLWAFKLDYENSEKEIADPLMDLKQGVETLRSNKTFRGILSTLLSIGIFLNGSEVKGFQIEYLAKVPEVKDTVHKHSLLHHLCHMVMEKFPEATDLYSEIGAVTRASKVDFDELATNILKMEQECKASWDHLKDIAKHDGSTIMKVKMTDFLADCAERIIVLGIVHRRVMNRYHKFLLWLGIPVFRVADLKPNEFCRIVSEFALEYRTTRERVLQQLEKKANHRERNKTRGKMITEVGKFRTKEDRADAELRQLLGNHATHGSDMSDAESVVHGSLPWRRQRKDMNRSVLAVNGHMTDGDDEILESLVKTATKAPGTRTTPRERKRTRHADLRRTLKNGLSEEDKKHLAAYIKGY